MNLSPEQAHQTLQMYWDQHEANQEALIAQSEKHAEEIRLNHTDADITLVNQLLSEIDPDNALVKILQDSHMSNNPVIFGALLKVARHLNDGEY